MYLLSTTYYLRLVSKNSPRKDKKIELDIPELGSKMKITKTGVIFFIFLAPICSVLTQECKEDKDPKCKRCDNEITTCLRFIGSALKGMEPMRMQNQSVCKVVEVRGLATIKYAKCACFKEAEERGKEGACYKQMVEITFDKLEVGCQLHNNIPQQIAGEVMNAGKAAGDKLMNAGKGMMGKIPGIGKRSAEGGGDMSCADCGGDGFKIEDVMAFANGGQCNTFFVNGSWTGLIVRLEMNLCFEDDIYNLTDVKVKETTFNGLKLWCAGCQIAAKLCCYITCHDIVRSGIGLCINRIARKALSDALEDPKIGDQLTALNCGDPDD